MTTKEFESVAGGIAYQAEKFNRGLIDGRELYLVLRASFGDDVFQTAKRLLDEVKE